MIVVAVTLVTTLLFAVYLMRQTKSKRRTTQAAVNFERILPEDIPTLPEHEDFAKCLNEKWLRTDTETGTKFAPESNPSVIITITVQKTENLLDKIASFLQFKKHEAVLTLYGQPVCRVSFYVNDAGKTIYPLIMKSFAPEDVSFLKKGTNEYTVLKLIAIANGYRIAQSDN